MQRLLVTLTVVEILALAIVLVVYLVAIARSLRRTSATLGKVSFGVRAIEVQALPIGPGVTRINGQLTTIAGALDGLAGLAEAAAPNGQATTPAAASAPPPPAPVTPSQGTMPSSWPAAGPHDPGPAKPVDVPPPPPAGPVGPRADTSRG